MRISKLVQTLGFAGVLSSMPLVDIPKDLHRWVLKMHKAQIELLKIDWGSPGFCTEWDRDYNPKTRTCGRRGRVMKRYFRSPP